MALAALDSREEDSSFLPAAKRLEDLAIVGVDQSLFLDEQTDGDQVILFLIGSRSLWSGLEWAFLCTYYFCPFLYK